MEESAMPMAIGIFIFILGTTYTLWNRTDDTVWYRSKIQGFENIFVWKFAKNKIVLVISLLQTHLNRTNQRIAREVFADDFMRYKLSVVNERSKLAKNSKNRSEYMLHHVIWVVATAELSIWSPAQKKNIVYKLYCIIV